MKQRFLTMLTSGALALMVAAPAVQAADEVLTVGWAEPIDTLNPATTGARNVAPIIAHIFDTLLWLNSDAKLEPLLATDWSASADAKTYTFNLRQDVKFHDGTPFNAQAVIANIEYIIDPDTQSKISISLIGPCKTFTAPSEYTLVVNCETPYAPFMSNISQPYMGIQSPTAIKTYGAELGLHPVGTGPFIHVAHDPSQFVKLKRNDDYNWMAPSLGHTGAPSLSEINFQIVPNPQSRVSQFQAGQSHIMQQTPGLHWKVMTAQNKYQELKTPISGMGIFAPINATKFPTDSLVVRRAIMHAVDMEGVIQLAEAGVYPVGTGPISAGMLGYDAALGNMYPYDVKKAAAMLTADGWSKTGEFWEKDGKPLTMDISAIASKAHYMALAQAIQGYLREFGMDAKISALAVPAWLAANVDATINMTPLQYVSVDPDALQLWFNAGQYFNWSHWSDEALTKLLGQAAGEVDRAKRGAMYVEAQTIIMENAVLMPVRQNIDLTLASKDLQGLTYIGGGFQYFAAASFVK